MNYSLEFLDLNWGKSMSCYIKELHVLYVNGKIDESGQFRLLTFTEISGRRMKELGSGSS